MIIKCIQCNKQFKRSQSEIKKYNKNGNIFCSRSCISFYKHIDLICLTCSKKFNVKKSEEKKGRKYCSIICAYNDKKRMSKKRIILTCPICNKYFEANKFSVEKGFRKFCSNDCRLKYYESKNIEIQCSYCNKFLKRPQSLIKGKKNLYCSIKCLARDMTDGKMSLENNPNWQGGKSFEPYGIEFNNELKEKIRQRDNYICQECGYNQDKLNYKLMVHHIDYNKQNNNKDNLISLCGSCHSQTNFLRNDWIKYFNFKQNIWD